MKNELNAIALYTRVRTKSTLLAIICREAAYIIIRAFCGFGTEIAFLHILCHMLILTPPITGILHRTWPRRHAWGLSEHVPAEGSPGPPEPRLCDLRVNTRTSATRRRCISPGFLKSRPCASLR